MDERVLVAAGFATLPWIVPYFSPSLAARLHAEERNVRVVLGVISVAIVLGIYGLSYVPNGKGLVLHYGAWGLLGLVIFGWGNYIVGLRAKIDRVDTELGRRINQVVDSVESLRKVR